MRLHPLHNAKMLLQWMEFTGEYPDPTRCTGRTTAQALRGIAWCIANPYKTLRIVDHHGTRTANDSLRRTMQDMVKALNLEHFHFTGDCARFGDTVPPALIEQTYTSYTPH